MSKHTLRCETCTRRDCHLNSENFDDSFADYTMYKRIQKHIAMKGCASHSAAKDVCITEFIKNLIKEYSIKINEADYISVADLKIICEYIEED